MGTLADLIQDSKAILDRLPEKKFDLVFYAYDERLVGTVGKEAFAIHAVSGGGRGRIEGKPEVSLASFSPNRAMKGGQRGGSLPPGLWKIAPPSTYTGKKAKPVSPLIPIGDQRIDYPTRDYDIAPFLIHGRGPEGSDGCIVIEPTERKRLLNAVEKQGGAILLVTFWMDGRLSKALDRQRTA